jgi:DNA-binding response OmpR family regulator
MDVKQISILVVGGDLETRQTLFIGLRDRKYHCLAATGIDNAKLLMTARRFDLVLCELELTDGSGLALCRQVKQISPNTAVVVMSEPVARRYEADAKPNGVDAFLRKPFEWAQLDQLIRSILPQN